MLGLKDDEAMPESIRIDQAVYCLTLFYIEQNSSQRINKTVDFENEIVERRSHFPRDGALREAIEMKILGLISPFRKTERFMTDEDTTA